MDENMISVAQGFQTSINIAYDLNNKEKIHGFIPTLSSMEVLEDVLLSTADNSTQRARMFVGAYGRGKSHIILVLLALLRIKDKALFESVLDKAQKCNPNLYEFLNEYITSSKKMLPIVVSGSSSSLTQSFLSALQQALADAEMSDLMPETHFIAASNTICSWKNSYPDTYNKFVEMLNVPVNQFLLRLKEFDVNAFELFQTLYPQLTSGSSFNPFWGFDVVDLYEKVIDKLPSKGYSGAFIVYDEFSKFLESSIANASISDIKLLQDFAEKCNRSGKKQMHLMLICHKDITNYIDSNLPKDKVDGWRGVSGRFKHITLHNNFSQMYEIIAAVIKKEPHKWDEFEKLHKKAFDDLAARFTASGLLDKGDAHSVDSAILGCYPLHPISTFILPRISEKVAQNERTLFTFLSSDEKYTLVAFLRTIAADEFVMLTPDYLYDYFEPLLRKEPYTSNTHKQYKLTESVLRRVKEGSLGAKIIKTISLIYIVEQFEKLPPIIDVITTAYQDSVSDIKVISDTIAELRDKECLVYLKRSNNYLKLKESSGIDIQNEIARKVENIKSTSSVTSILNAFSFDNYLYPTRYNDEKEITRYFDFVFISSNDFWNITDWDSFFATTEADGVVLALVPKSQTDIVDIQKHIVSMEKPSNRVVFIVPNVFKEIDDIAFEYNAVLALKQLASDDDVLSDEYDIYIEDLEEVISSYISSFTRPELGKSMYYLRNKHRSVMRKAQVSELLSDICIELFPNTPIINNESINKNKLPTVAVNSRTKLLTGLLADDFAPNLGLSGSGQDVSIMRSTLVQTGILSNLDTIPTIVEDISDADISRVLSVIRQFFTEATEGNEKSFKILYDELTLPNEYGIGLKREVIPIYIALVLHQCKQNIVITYNSQETKLSADLLNGINETPEAFNVIYVNWNDEKRQYMAELENIFSDYVFEKEKAFNSFSYLVLAMNRWYMSLPKYAKEMEYIYHGMNTPNEKIPKDKRRFINSLKQGDANAREFLFEKILSIFNLKEFNLVVVDAIRRTKQIFDEAKENLVSVLILDVKTIFSAMNAKSSLCSAAKDWYENLNPNTINHLFAANESRILDVFKSITNDDVQFLERIAKVTCSLRIDDWDAKTIDYFITTLVNFKKAVDSYDENTGLKSVSADQYRVTFVDTAGNEITKSFGKAEYSSRAKLLLNAVSNAIDEMGESISDQEKRQVLIDLLEKLC
jgi:hypothetical protein